MKQNSTTSVCTATSSWGGSDNQYVDSFIADLHKQRYAGDTIRRYLGIIGNFSRWMDQHQACPAEINDAAIDRYLTTLAQSPKPPSGDRKKEIAGALHALLQYLRRQGVIAHPEPPPLTIAQQWVVKYDTYLDRIVGLAPTTRKRYLYFAGRFLSSICTTEFPDWSSITADRISEFVLQDAAKRRGHGPQSPATAVRSLLRFLVTEGVIHSGLELALPRIRRWAHKALPQPFSESERSLILVTANDGTPIGKRNYAILLLLSRLGLRAKEVMRLHLNDIDWRRSTILIRAGKTHCERLLPLDEEIGKALLEYLRNGRPPTDHREIFLTHCAPYQPLRAVSAITNVVKRSVARTSLPLRSAGAHMFRHSVATELVCRGASFKQVADLLGHQSLQTTAIYAKLDLNSLQQVAMPWPGGAQ
jgi:site-specific recombinase XerD